MRRNAANHRQKSKRKGDTQTQNSKQNDRKEDEKEEEGVRRKNARKGKYSVMKLNAQTLTLTQNYLLPLNYQEIAIRKFKYKFRVRESAR